MISKQLRKAYSKQKKKLKVQILLESQIIRTEMNKSKYLEKINTRTSKEYK